MSQIVADLVATAAAGDPVFISAVRAAFEVLPEQEAFTITARLGALDGGDWVYRFTLPRFEALADGERRLATEFLLAGLYNVISTVGGRGLRLVPDERADGATFAELAATVDREFGMTLARAARPGYGRAVNVAERMAAAVGGPGAVGRFAFAAADDIPDAPKVAAASGAAGILDVCRAATDGLGDRAILGIDVGGTDIKLCLALGGHAIQFVEYDWFPAAFTRTSQLIDPIVLLTRLLRVVLAGATAASEARAGIAAALEGRLEGVLELDGLEAAVAAGEAAAGSALPAFDAIGVCFPDVVVRDKIVGGEVYKTRGIRTNPSIDYEAEFRTLSDLDALLRAFVRPDGVVGIVNDGPMAAFTAAVETAVVDEAAVTGGVFAHTLGTELGTGWVTEAGSIPDIPLEIYNCVIDLGSYPERAFEPDDVRSVRNFNTLIPGTLQKFASQSGVFRLAMKYFPQAEPALWREILEAGFVVARGDGWYVPTAPRDLRKPFLEFLMGLTERGSNATVERIFRELGAAMAVAWTESKWLLDPATDHRILFGRVVKRRACFDLMVEGARGLAPSIDLAVADDELANTALMRQLRDHPHHTVAQFAQAVGAIHYANFRLAAKSMSTPPDQEAVR